MTDTCNCIAEVNEKLAERNGELSITLWPVIRPILETNKVDTKMRVRPPMIVATYCPFCGTKYPGASS